MYACAADDEKVLRILAGPRTFVQSLANISGVAADETQLAASMPAGASLPALGLSNKPTYDSASASAAAAAPGDTLQQQQQLLLAAAAAGGDDHADEEPLTLPRRSEHLDGAALDAAVTAWKAVDEMPWREAIRLAMRAQSRGKSKAREKRTRPSDDTARRVQQRRDTRTSNKCYGFEHAMPS